MSSVITRSANARTCGTGVVQVRVHVQVHVQVHVHVKVRVQMRVLVTHVVPQLDAFDGEWSALALWDG